MALVTAPEKGEPESLRTRNGSIPSKNGKRVARVWVRIPGPGIGGIVRGHAVQHKGKTKTLTMRMRMDTHLVVELLAENDPSSNVET